MVKKSDREAFDEVLNESAFDVYSAIIEDQTSINDLLATLSTYLKTVGISAIDKESSPEKDIELNLGIIANYIYEVSDGKTEFSLDKLALTFYHLGLSVGRQQVIKQQLPAIHDVIKNKVARSGGGTISKYEEFEKIIRHEIEKHLKLKRRQKETIREIEKHLEDNLPRSTFTNWLSNYNKSKGKNIFYVQ